MSRVYCDNCGDMVRVEKVVVYESLPFDIASANAGESAVICRSCDYALTFAHRANPSDPMVLPFSHIEREECSP